MNKKQNEILNTISDIDKISSEIHNISLRLQELETSLYTIQKKIYFKAAEPQKERN